MSSLCDFDPSVLTDPPAFMRCIRATAGSFPGLGSLRGPFSPPPTPPAASRHTRAPSPPGHVEGLRSLSNSPAGPRLSADSRPIPTDPLSGRQYLAPVPVCHVDGGLGRGSLIWERN